MNGKPSDPTDLPEGILHAPVEKEALPSVSLIPASWWAAMELLICCKFHLKLCITLRD